MSDKKRTSSGKKDITLRDVVMHLSAMEQRLSSKIEANTRGIEGNTRSIEGHSRIIEGHTRSIDENTAAIRDLTLRIDALEEDLTATIKDTAKIRRHVGMATPDE